MGNCMVFGQMQFFYLALENLFGPGGSWGDCLLEQIAQMLDFLRDIHFLVLQDLPDLRLVDIRCNGCSLLPGNIPEEAEEFPLFALSQAKICK